MDMVQNERGRRATDEELEDISNASMLQFHEDGVPARIRRGWTEKNRDSLCTCCDRFVRVSFQWFALSRGVEKIWDGGRHNESQKTPDDILEPEAIRSDRRALQFWLELVLITPMPGTRAVDASATPIFRKSFRRAILNARGMIHEDDQLLALPICFSDVGPFARTMGLAATGIRSPQRGLPLLSASLRAVVTEI